MRRSNLPFPWSFLLTYVKLFCPHKMWQSWLIPCHMVGVEICAFLIRKYVFIFQKKKKQFHKVPRLVRLTAGEKTTWWYSEQMTDRDSYPLVKSSSLLKSYFHWLPSLPMKESCITVFCPYVIQWNAFGISDPTCVPFFGYVLLLRRCQSVFLQPLNVAVASFSQSVFQRSVYFTLMNKSSPVLVLS